MVRPRGVATLVIFLLLANAIRSEALGSCPGCTVYLYLDSPQSDIPADGNYTPNTPPVKCADLCFSNPECIGFVISPDRNCWLKSALLSENDFNSNSERTIVRTGDNNCQGLFSN